MDSKFFAFLLSLQGSYSCSAAYLRQSIFLTAFETPETRSLYNSYLTNISGKVRTDLRRSPIAVPEGINQVSTVCLVHTTSLLTFRDQSFVHFDCVRPMDEADKRFYHFTTQVLS